MKVSATVQSPLDTEADTVAIGVFDGKAVAHDVPGGVLQALLDAGEARTSFRHLAVAHAEGKRWIVVGLGSRDDFTAERARRAAAAVHGRAKELGSSVLCWELPHRLSDDEAGAFVEGTVLSAYRFTRYRSADTDDDGRGLSELIVSDHDDRAAAVTRATVLAEAQNRARTLQDTPANDCTPTALAEAARVLTGVDVDVVLGHAALVERGMGAFAAVAQAANVAPALITIRYVGPGAPDGPPLALVGKAVTHDTGGLSIKPAGGMHRMKFDMSGGAAVLQAIAAIAELQLPLNIVGVIGATENVVGPDAVKPGDIVTASDGTTIEVNNTDAEGRLVLGDCLVHARGLGAGTIVDIATLTGGVVTALGDVYAGLFASDDALAAAALAAGERTGERVWRLPLDPEYAELVKGRYAQLQNSGEHKKAHPIQGAEFIHHFAGDVPWAHLDIAGVGWDAGRPYAAKGGSGFGVRLLVALAEALG